MQVPSDAAAARALAASATPASALFNNCSGKHAGMLALARLLGASLEEYIDPEHPAQRAIRDTLVDLLDLDPAHLHVGLDGCSAPAYAVPLRAMARGFALLCAPSTAPKAWQGPLETIASAMRGHPVLVGGTHHRLGWLTDHDLANSLSEYGPELPLFNLAGRRVGEVRPAPL